jgi:hypothetical protein
MAARRQWIDGNHPCGMIEGVLQPAEFEQRPA